MLAGFSFGLLGPLTASWDSVPIRVSAHRQRAVLAMLLLEVGRPVPAHRLVEEIWGEDAPQSALNNLQVQISALRRALRAPSPQDIDGGVIAAQHGGYVLDVPQEAIDVHEFRGLVADGASQLQHGSFEQAADLLRDALKLWRADPLQEFVGLAFAEVARVRLQAEYVAALTSRVEADLALGRHLALVAELRELVARYPDQERLRGQLMLALYRAGQQVEALRVYSEGRAVLVDELGMDPGPEL